MRASDGWDGLWTEMLDQETTPGTLAEFQAAAQVTLLNTDRSTTPGWAASSRTLAVSAGRAHDWVDWRG